MKRASLIVLSLVLLLVGACAPVQTANPTRAQPPGANQITPRMLVAPHALVGPTPSSFSWSPTGALLAYIAPGDADQDVLWLYDPVTQANKLLVDPGKISDELDLTTAQWSPDSSSLLLGGAKALWLVDVQSGALKPLAQDNQAKTSMMFTPDGAHVSYAENNNLYVIGIAGGQAERLTSDGGDAVFNGTLDWVYNEELATRAAQPAYAWSPDGKQLFYMRLDESAVHNDPVTDYRPVPAAVSYTRYPTVGTANPTVSLQLLDRAAGAPAKAIPLPAGSEYVLPFFTWTPDGQEALYITVNRDHTLLQLNAWNPSTGSGRTLVQETDPAWINEERYAPPVFLGSGAQFLWLSERDGFMHLYLYGRDGKLARQLTQGTWMIDTSAWDLLTPGRPVHVDPAGKAAYFISTRVSPLDRQVERLDVTTGQLTQVTQEAGFHLAALSGDGRYLVEQFSNTVTPPLTRVLATDGSGTQVLAPSVPGTLALPALSREFLTIRAHDGTDLYTQLVKPANFDPHKKYPVVVHWYGGPGLQMVSDRYGTTNIFNIIERDVLYTQAGFLVWRLDNRGSFGRGHGFETPIFGQLGKAALDDQLAGVEYLQTLPYVDTAHIGTDGKSFGGYMTLYALLYTPEVFHCGVAGAAPTDWSYYDTIYTERYMRTPEVNAEGYAATNLIARAGLLQAAPLLIHGLADTNVHLQNSVNFIQALETADLPFTFVPVPNTSHSFHGDALVTMLTTSTDYLEGCLGGQR